MRGFTDSIRSELIHDKSKVHITMVQLPAVNTPQFDWVKNKLPRRAKPVGPVYQPEVIARAIYWAAHNKRREVFVGVPAAKAILGNKVIPGPLDHYLADAAYSGQQTDKPNDGSQRFNLWEPVPGDHGAHGRFDAKARTWSPQFWLSKHRTWLGIFAAACAGITTGRLLARRSH
jgi:hypothetical protein